MLFKVRCCRRHSLGTIAVPDVTLHGSDTATPDQVHDGAFGFSGEGSRDGETLVMLLAIYNLVTFGNTKPGAS
jgi:hypothetical protein